MEPFRYHVFVCTQPKPEGHVGCCSFGSERVLDALRRELAKARLNDEVQVTTCGSLGLCERGPNLIVYPEGIWYSKVQPTDVAEIVREHFLHNRPVARLVNTDPVVMKAEMLESRRRYLAWLATQQPARV